MAVTKTRTPRTPRKKKLKLTAAEKKILLYPPTTGTWICPSAHGEDPPMVAYNLAESERCWICAVKKPAKAKLLWPEYVAACKKVGIEPGYMWKINGTTLEPMIKEMGKADAKWERVPDAVG